MQGQTGGQASHLLCGANRLRRVHLVMVPAQPGRLGDGSGFAATDRPPQPGPHDPTTKAECRSA